MGSKEEETDPVEQLLAAAQDEVMLSLSVDTHMARLEPDYLHHDLNRRFLALRGRNHPPPPPSSASRDLPSTATADIEPNDPLRGDLAARFAALKTTLPTSNLSSSSVSSSPEDHLSSSKPGPVNADGDDEEDEIEKLIRWAKDAARLDPSPPSDDEHQNTDYNTSDDDDESEASPKHKK